MRLIDADLLKLNDFEILLGGSYKGLLQILLEKIEDAPTVDAVEVVRCKDCKWYEIAQIKRDGTEDKRYKPSVCVIGRYAASRKADWYCADGERREDETD